MSATGKIELKRWTRPEVPIVSILNSRERGFHQPITHHEEHEINLILSGEAEYLLGKRSGEPITAAAGQIVLMPAGTLHTIDAHVPFDVAAIHVHARAFARLSTDDRKAAALARRLRTWKRPPKWRTLAAPEMFAMLEHFARDTLAEQNGRSPARIWLLQQMARQAAVYFLRLMLTEEKSPDGGPTAQAVFSVKHWIDRHFDQPCDIDRLARMAHLAPTYFAARFHDLVGTPPMTYVRDRRMAQARLLLQQTTDPVKQVAASVGYADIRQFNRVFRRTTGTSPAAYRDANDA